jgi:hypothetical protein
MWNAQATGTLTLFPNYVATTGMTNPSGIGSVVAAANAGFTGAIGCTAAPTQTSNIVNFATVSAPATGNTTACDYKNALSIEVSSNDPNGFTVSEQLGIAPGTGFVLCGLPNGPLVGTPSTSSPMGASTATSTSTSINETSCSGSGQITLGSGNTTPASTSVSSSSTGTFFEGQDVLLLVAPGVAIGTYSSTLTVTLTIN